MKRMEDPAKVGIGIRRYILKHEQDIRDGKVTLAEHREKLAWMQHERLVHLIVMCLTAIAMLLCLILVFVADEEFGLAFLALSTILLVFTCFYIRHYFFLENHVQYWYLLCEQLKNADETQELDGGE